MKKIISSIKVIGKDTIESRIDTLENYKNKPIILKTTDLDRVKVFMNKIAKELGIKWEAHIDNGKTFVFQEGANNKKVAKMLFNDVLYSYAEIDTE